MTTAISPSLFAAVFEHSLDAVLLAHPGGSIVAANKAACNLLGLDEAEICRRGRAGIVDPASPDLQGMLTARATQGFARAELLLVHSDGTRIPVDTSLAVFADEGGEAWSVIIGRDSRERKEYEDGLVRSRLLLDTIVNSTADFIWVVDPDDYGILWHNRAFEDYFARDRGIVNLPGLRPSDIFADQALVKFWEDLYQRAREEGSTKAEYRVSAGTHVLDLTLTAIKGEEGLIGISVFGRDITEASQARQRLQASEARYRTIVNTISEGIVFQAADGTILSSNPAAARIEDRDEDEMVGKTSEDPQWGAVRADGRPFPGEDHPAMYTLRTGEPQHGVIMGIRTPRGERRWITINSAPVFDAGEDHPNAVVTTFHDITAEKQAEDELRISAIAFESSQEAMVIAGPDGTILRVNQAFTDMTGYSAAEAVGQPTSLVSSGLQDAAFYREMWDTLASEHRWQGEVWNRRRDGEVYPCWLSISAVTDVAGRITHYVGTSTDLSAAKKAQEDIIALAFYDTLTGLPNRRLLLDRIRQTLRARSEGPHRGALVFIDLADFTILNETRGHAAGDRLLTEVGNRLQALVGAEDTVARLGSDEFAILLADLDSDLNVAVEQAQRAAQRLRSAIAEPLEIDGQEYQCRTSVGIAMFGDGQPGEQDLLKHADLALTLAKRDGQDAARFYDREVQTALEHQVRLETDLSQAIPDGLRLWYQPQVGVSGEFLGAEALVRWQDPERGIVSPADFIPMAEENGMIVPIGRWVLETACRQLAAWRDDPATGPLTISVNVSARQVHRPDFADMVLGVLAETGADPSRLVLELTESMLVADLGALAETMILLRSRGVSFSLDDFGTGFSSLRSLRELPIGELKIDQSFVCDLPDDPNDLAIVRTIVGLGRSLGLSVIAEGVETAEQRAALAGLGCTRYQGYLFARPLPIEEFTALINDVDAVGRGGTE